MSWRLSSLKSLNEWVNQTVIYQSIKTFHNWKWNQTNSFCSNYSFYRYAFSLLMLSTITCIFVIFAVNCQEFLITFICMHWIIDINTINLLPKQFQQFQLSFFCSAWFSNLRALEYKRILVRSVLSRSHDIVYVFYSPIKIVKWFYHRSSWSDQLEFIKAFCFAYIKKILYINTHAQIKERQVEKLLCV